MHRLSLQSLPLNTKRHSSSYSLNTDIICCTEIENNINAKGRATKKKGALYFSLSKWLSQAKAAAISDNVTINETNPFLCLKQRSLKTFSPQIHRIGLNTCIMLLSEQISLLTYSEFQNLFHTPKCKLWDCIQSTKHKSSKSALAEGFQRSLVAMRGTLDRINPPRFRKWGSKQKWWRTQKV